MDLPGATDNVRSLRSHQASGSEREHRQERRSMGTEFEHRRCELRLEEFEARIRALEGWRAEKAGEERRLSTVSAGAGGVVGGVVAVLVKVLGGG